MTYVLPPESAGSASPQTVSPISFLNQVNKNASTTAFTNFKFNSNNVVYIRNLSPLVTENDIKKIFMEEAHIQPSDILYVQFKNFPQSTQRFVEISFTGSGGVTSAISLNNHLLLGLPMAVSVIDPLLASSSALSYDNSDGLSHTAILNLALQNQAANAQAVSLASLQARQLAEQKRTQLKGMGISSGGVGTVGGVSASRGEYKFIQETEEDEIARTVCISNLPENFTVESLKKLIDTSVGVVTAVKVDDYARRPSGKTSSRFGLVQFSNRTEALRAKKLHNWEIAEGVFICVEKSLTTVEPRDPDGVRFDLPALPAVPVAYQQIHKFKLEEKMTRAREIQIAFTRRLTSQKAATDRENETRSTSKERGRDSRSTRGHFRERDRCRDGDYNRERSSRDDHEKDSDRDRHREKDRERDRERDRHRDRDRDRIRDRERYRERDREKDKEKDKEKDREKDRVKDREKKYEIKGSENEDNHRRRSSEFSDDEDDKHERQSEKKRTRLE